MRRNQSAKTQDVTQTAAFRRWSKGAPVIQEGAPLPEYGPFVVKAYHGSFADIEAFWTDGPEAPEDDEGEHRIEANDPNVYWGAHFALEPHVADKFAGVGGDVRWLKMRQGAGSVYPVYLRLENAAVMTEQEMLRFSLTQRLPSWIGDDLTDEVEHYARTLGLDEDAVWDWYEAGGLNPDGNNVREEINRSIADAVADWEWSEGTSPHVDLLQDLGNQAKAALQAQGYDSVIYQNEVEGGTSVIVFSPTQIKSAIGNRGTFDPEDPDIRHNPRKASSPIDNPAFRRWFGGSEVVDKHGRPKVVYHGAPGGGFTVFRRGEGICFTDKWGVAISYIEDFDEDFGLGTHSSDPTTPLGAPENYEDGIYAVYLRIENPLYVDAGGADFNEIPLDDTGLGYRPGDTGSISDFVRHAEREGYDGLIVENVYDMGPHYRTGPEVKSTIYVVFDPRQIKSASVQRGTYDPEDPDIRHNPRRLRR